MSEHPFKPPWWLRNPHLQTIWPLFRSFPKDLAFVPERLELADGDFLDLVWLGSGKKPIVLILHGFEGSLDSHYAKSILQVIQANGWRGVLMHFRGCSGEPNRLLRNYHSGETGDLETVVRTLIARESTVPFAAIGFSLGGNVLLKWLGETGKQNPLKAAIAISVPFELEKAVKHIHQGFSKIYEKHLLRSVISRLSIKYQSQRNDFSLPSEIASLEDFDNKVTAPLHGFKNAKDYYDQSSSRPFLKKIATPTLLLQAKDDPFMPHEVIPDKRELSSFVQLELTTHGGHVGFIQGKFPWKLEYWLEKKIPAFLRKYL